uniref:Uncharacterized protein n=1 Tax=Triticum urartu TaxID=4572 RepID=A0A8R7TFP9_TRIUA
MGTAGVAPPRNARTRSFSAGSEEAAAKGRDSASTSDAKRRSVLGFPLPSRRRTSEAMAMDRGAFRESARVCFRE